jgi:hypothetical protein
MTLRWFSWLMTMCGRRERYGKLPAWNATISTSKLDASASTSFLM